MSRSLLGLSRNPLHISSSFSNRISSFQPLTTVRAFNPPKGATSVKDDFGIITGSKENPDELMPPYPYGKKQTYHQADRGLYGGSQIQFGNKISKGRNKGKTRRSWNPNVRMEKIRSEALDQELHIRITASCLRTINKCGGLDQYLLGDKPGRIKELGLFGWKLRWKVLNAPLMQAKFAEERARLGLPETDPANESFEAAWNDEDVRADLIGAQRDAWEQLKERSKRYEQHVLRRWNPADKAEHRVPAMSTLLLQSPETIDLNLPKLQLEQGS